MKTLLFNEKHYSFGLLSCFGTLITSSSIIAMKFPKPEIDLQVYYGSNYGFYFLLNLVIIISFVTGIIIMGLLIAERILKNRGYYEIIQKEEETRKAKDSRISKDN